MDNSCFIQVYREGIEMINVAQPGEEPELLFDRGEDVAVFGAIETLKRFCSKNLKYNSSCKYCPCKHGWHDCPFTEDVPADWYFDKMFKKEN